MVLRVNTDQPFRFPSELETLVRAVLAADDHDESLWVEWKAGMDLRLKETAWHISKHLLGFANREVGTANRWAGGYAYFVLGACPGDLTGVKSIDPAVLDQAVRRYVGSELRWHAEYASVDDQQVLVIAVDPPKPGDPVFAAQKSMFEDKIKAGTVLIRRPGKTEQADPAELRVIIDREKASQSRLDIDLIPPQEALERIIDPSSTVDEWLERENRRLQAGGVRKKTAFPDLRELGVQHPQIVQLAALHAAAADSANAALGFLTEPDSRTTEDYQREVDQYIDRCREVLLERFVRAAIRRPQHRLTLELINVTEKNFQEVQVSVHLAGNIRTFSDDDIDIAAASEPALPNPPLPLGTRRQKSIFAELDRIPGYALRGAFDSPRVRLGSAESASPPYRAHNTGSVSIEFRPCDLRPGQRLQCPKVPLIVPDDGSDVIEGTWSATACNVDGVIRGTLHIAVAASTFDVECLFSS